MSLIFNNPYKSLFPAVGGGGVRLKSQVAGLGLARAMLVQLVREEQRGSL